MTDSDRRSIAISEAPLSPENYPWRPIRESGVVAEGRFLPTDAIDAELDAAGAAPLLDRHPVLSVGSNASFDVMYKKMVRAGLDTPFAMTITRRPGVAVGHSAHVSLPGYIAAAPYRCANCVRMFVAVHLDDAQLAALDATEPSYIRVEHQGAWLYASRWQVLAVRGRPVTLRSQQELHTILASVDPTWRDQFEGLPGPDVAALLAHNGTINEWRHHWQSAGLTRHAGFDTESGL
ncbi:MAG: hypothetical protein ACR2N2_02960 [Acidimicrobiia bacterium]